MLKRVSTFLWPESSKSEPKHTSSSGSTLRKRKSSSSDSDRPGTSLKESSSVKSSDLVKRRGSSSFSSVEYSELPTPHISIHNDSFSESEEEAVHNSLSPVRMPAQLKRDSTQILLKTQTSRDSLKSQSSLKTQTSRTSMKSSSSVSSLKSRPSISKKSSISKQATLTKKASVAKQASLKKKPSLQKQATATKTPSLSKSGSALKRKSSLTKGASVAKQPSISKKKSLTKQVSLKKKSSLTKEPSLTKKTSLTKAVAKSVKQKAVGRKGKKGKAKADTGPPKKQLLYLRAEYVALRNDDAGAFTGFYLAQVLQHVYDTTDIFRIRWLESVKVPLPAGKKGDTFELKPLLVDNTQPECIITHVRLSRVAGRRNMYILPDSQKAKVMKALQKARDGPSSDEEEEEEEEEEGGKAKVRKTDKTPGKKSGKPKAASKPAKPKKPKVVKPKKPTKPKLTEEQRRNPNLLLVPNPKVKVYEREPFLYSSEAVPSISTMVYSKLVHRAVMLNDMKLLKKLIDDREHVNSAGIPYSNQVYIDALERAIFKNNLPAIRLLSKEFFAQDDPKKKKTPRCEATVSMLSQEGTGSYNMRSLGIRNVRKLQMSRGSREGNNALLRDVHHAQQSNKGFDKYIYAALKHGLPKSMIDEMYSIAYGRNADIRKPRLYDSLLDAIRFGHRKLAGQLIEDAMKTQMGQSFNFLHRDVLLFDGEDLKPFREASAKKKPWSNNLQGVTPIHCAAINPNTKYLAKLLSVLPEQNILDKQNRRPVHYAAACSGTGPLELLLKRGVDPKEADQSGFTSLHIACQTGRAHNVEVLLQKAQDDAEKAAMAKDDEDGSDAEDAGFDEDDEDGKAAATEHKYGMGDIDRPIMGNNMSIKFYGFCPIHLAVERHHHDVVKMLLKYGVDLHKPLSASKNKRTALMMAAEQGELETVKLLIKHKARVEEKDKLKRTPLMHAAMNGHAHVVSYLLSLGANPNVADSSGNTVMHYATAYGWYFCVKSLIQAGADCDVANDWKMTPMWITFLKGHMGLVDVLLKQPGMDINYKGGDGKTLLMVACSSSLEKGLDGQIRHLVEHRNACPKQVDELGNNCLHLLAMNPLDTRRYARLVRNSADISVAIAKILINNGCDVNALNEKKETPLMSAIMIGENEPLIRFLAEQSKSIPVDTDKSGSTLLHHMAQNSVCFNQYAILQHLLKSLKKAGAEAAFRKMATKVNDSGYTPLLVACKAYHDWNGSGNRVNDDDDDDEDGDDDEDEDEDDDDAKSDGSEDKGSEGDEENELENGDADDDDDGGDDDDADNEDDMDASDAGGDDGDDIENDEMNGDDDEDGDDDNDDDGSEQSDSETEKRGRKKGKKDKKTEKPGKEKRYHEDKKTEWVWEDDMLKNGRDFIRLLIDQLKSDIEFEVQPKKEVEGFVKPKNYNPYHVPSEGKYRPISYMIEVERERPLYNKDGSVTKHPGLTMLLGYGPDVNFFDDQGYTLLLRMINSGKWDVESKLEGVEQLVEEDADLNEASQVTKKNKTSVVPVIAAAKKGLSKVLCHLVENGAKINDWVVAENDNTTLHLAVNHSRDETDVLSMVKCLLRAGATVNAVNAFKQTPLHLAVARNPGGTDITAEVESSLIEAGAKLDAADLLSRTPLHYVFISTSECTHTDPIEVCMTLTAKMTAAEVNKVDEFGRTALHYAGHTGAGVSAMNLVKKKANINAQDTYGNTAFTLSAMAKHESCCILLLQQDADFNVDAVYISKAEEAAVSMEESKMSNKKKIVAPSRDGWQWAPVRTSYTEWKAYPVFQVCVYNGWQGIVFMMLDRLDTRPWGKHTSGLDAGSTVQAAINTGKLNLALTLLRRMKVEGKSPETKNEKQQNLFHILAIRGNQENQVELQLRVAELLKEMLGGSHLRAQDKFGNLPLHYACYFHDANLVNFFLNEGVDQHVTNNAGITPYVSIFCNLEYGRKEEWPKSLKSVVSAFKVTSSVLNGTYSFPAVHAALFDFSNQDTSRSKQESHFQHDHDKVKITILIQAIAKHDFATVKYLLSQGCDLNATDTRGRTPLMRAVKMNDINFVKVLLDPSYVPGEEKADKRDIDSTGNHDDDESPSRGIHFGGGRRRYGKKPRGRTFGITGAKKTGKAGSPSKKKAPKDEVWDAKPFKKTSNVKLNVVDNDGWSVVHHLVAPLEYGTYDNVRILKILAENGADLDMQSPGDAHTPLSLALDGAPKLAAGLQRLMKTKNIEVPTPVDVSVRDKISWGKEPKYDYAKDAAEFLRKLSDERKESEKDQEKKLPKPDSRLNIADGEVVLDADHGDLYFDVLLTKIEVHRRPWGLFNFYKMQIVYQKVKDLYVLFNRWGRIGDEGQYQKTPFASRDEVVKEFCKIFRAKTKNKWTDVKSFINHPGKYRLVPASSVQHHNKKLKDISFDLSTTKPTKLPSKLMEVMKEISNEKMLTSAARHCDIDYHAMPLGRVDKVTLDQAKKILLQIAKLVNRIDKKEANEEGFELVDLAADYQEIIRLSNEYFHLIPQKSYAFEKIEPLYQVDSLNEQFKLVQNLSELQLAGRMLAGAQLRSNEVNPMDYIYRNLDCKLELMDEDDVETQYLLKYIQNTAKEEVLVDSIFKIERDGEMERLRDCKFDNHRLLFHGTFSSNLVSILRRGLITLAPGTIFTGNSYGDGVYFSDSFDKSNDYARPSYAFKTNKRFMLICQVALGKVKVLNERYDSVTEEDQRKFDCVKAKGTKTPNDNYYVTLPEGCNIPLGSPASTSRSWWASWTEYVIPREEQICMRYLIVLRDDTGIEDEDEDEDEDRSSTSSRSRRSSGSSSSSSSSSSS